MRNRLDKRGCNFNEIHIPLHPLKIRLCIKRIRVQARVRVANPNCRLTPLHVKGLPVKLLDGYMRLSTEPLLVSMKESKTASDVVEHGILCVSPFGTLGAGDQPNAVYVGSKRTGPRSFARAGPSEKDQRFNPMTCLVSMSLHPNKAKEYRGPLWGGTVLSRNSQLTVATRRAGFTLFMSALAPRKTYLGMVHPV